MTVPGLNSGCELRDWELGLIGMARTSLSLEKNRYRF